MPALSQNFGKEAENAAAHLLEQKGYKILARNWRFKKLELDIIAFEGKTLVVVEVKARTSTFFGEPESFVSKSKQKRIIQAAEQYISEIQFDGETRFDIIAAIPEGNGFNLHHITKAFAPSLI